MAAGFFLVWDDGDPESVTAPSKVRRARYATLDEARAQGEHDLSLGKRVLRIEDEAGATVWEP